MGWTGFIWLTGQVAGFCEHGKEPSVAQNMGNFLTSGRNGRHLYIQTLKTLQKRFRAGRPHKSLLKSTCNTTRHDHTFQNTARNQKTRTDCPSHPPYSPDLASAISASLRISRCHPWDKFGSTMRLLKKQRSGREYKIQTDTRRGEMALLLGGARLLNLMGLI